MTSRVIKLIGEDWFNRIPNDVIEQEELIQAWKYPELEFMSGLLAFISLLYQTYEEKKKSLGSELLSDFSKIPAKSDLQELDQSSILDEGLSPHLSKYTLYERYILYLLSINTKKEVQSILDCTPSYMSKVLGRIKSKYLSPKT